MSDLQEFPESKKCFFKGGKKEYAWGGREGFISKDDDSKISSKGPFPSGTVIVYQFPDLSGDTQEMDITEIFTSTLQES